MEDTQFGGYIYKVTNTVNNKIYIGQTTRSVDVRWREHCSRSKNINKNDTYFDKIVHKYGINNFIVEELCTASSRDELDRLEADYIQEFQSYAVTKGYNVRLGGNKSKNSGIIFPNRRKKKKMGKS